MKYFKWVNERWPDIVLGGVVVYSFFGFAGVALFLSAIGLVMYQDSSDTRSETEVSCKPPASIEAAMVITVNEYYTKHDMPSDDWHQQLALADYYSKIKQVIHENTEFGVPFEDSVVHCFGNVPTLRDLILAAITQYKEK